MFYNPANWYWSGQPAGQTATVIYSSARGALVAATDAAYVAWLAAGNAPTPWPRDATGAVTSAALDAVLEAAGLPATGLTPPTVAQLLAYVGEKVAGLIGASRSYTSATTPAVTIQSDATGATLSNLQALQKWGAANPTATTVWLDNAMNNTTVTGAEIEDIGNQVGDYALSIYGVEGGAVVAAIKASPPTITTYAQVDAFGWTV